MSYHRPYDKQFSYVGSSNGLLFICIYSFLMCIFDHSLYCMIQNITFGTFLIMDTDFSCQYFGFICINVCAVVFGSMYCIPVGICKYHYLCFWLTEDFCPLCSSQVRTGWCFNIHMKIRHTEKSHSLKFLFAVLQGMSNCDCSHSH